MNHTNLTLDEHRAVLAQLRAAAAPIEPIGALMGPRERELNPWEHFYFRPVGPELYDRALDLAQAVSRVNQHSKKRVAMIENSDLIGKVGELVFDEFCDYYYGAARDRPADYRALYPPQLRWQAFCHTDQHLGGDVTDFEIEGRHVDVKTRRLRTDVTIRPTFDLCVPRHELRKPQDVYVLAGFCPTSEYAYVIGWCAYSELQAKPLNEQLAFPAKCVPLGELYRMDTLAPYLRAISR